MSEFDRVAKADRELDRFNEWHEQHSRHVSVEVTRNGPHYVPSEYVNKVNDRLRQRLADVFASVRIDLENELREAAASAQERIEALSKKDPTP